MVLADTSVWIEHFRQGNSVLAGLLNDAMVFAHPFVIGELACGNLKNRATILAHLNALPSVAVASHPEVFELIESHRLWGLGIGWTDCHLLASTLLDHCPLWTLDQRLNQAARATGITTFRSR